MSEPIVNGQTWGCAICGGEHPIQLGSCPEGPEFAAKYREMAGLIRDGNRAGMLAAVAGRARAKAERAALRLATPTTEGDKDA